jgi:hypothetical protein
MIYFIVILLLVLFIILYFCIKFAILLINTRDAIEESLDIIDSKYNDISKILDIPIFNDSYEIKAILSRLEDARNSLLYIANTLAKNSIIQEEDKIEYYDSTESKEN